MRKEQKINEFEFEQKRLDTTFVIQSMLFGDGAVALLVGNEEGKPSFGPIAHLTNEDAEDVNLLTMNSRSSHEFLKGRPQYFMRPSVPNRGAHYAVSTVKDVLRHPDSPVSNMDQVDDCLIHTGSKKILDGVCSQLHLEKDSTKVQGSYDVLKNLWKPLERFNRLHAGRERRVDRADDCSGIRSGFYSERRHHELQRN